MAPRNQHRRRNISAGVTGGRWLCYRARFIESKREGQSTHAHAHRGIWIKSHAQFTFNTKKNNISHHLSLLPLLFSVVVVVAAGSERKEKASLSLSCTPCTRPLSPCAYSNSYSIVILELVGHEEKVTHSRSGSLSWPKPPKP
jgi:hypothetical protein